MKTVALYVDVAKKARLALSNMVKIRKDQIRIEIAQKAKLEFIEHIATLNKRIGKPYLSFPQPDFSAPMKGLKKIDTLQNAVDTLMSQAKILANAEADKIEINLNALRDLAKDHAFLFSDAGHIVLKAPDDLIALVKMRITEHQAAEAKKEAEQREKIRLEEEAKAEAKVRAETKAKEDLDRAAQQVIAVTATMPPEPATPSATAVQAPPLVAQNQPVAVAAPVRQFVSQMSGEAKLRDQIDDALAGMNFDELSQALVVLNAIVARRLVAA